jgi:predicted small secreted protein
MPQNTNLNISPYFDDFDSSKNYHRVLWKPEYPVQARELNTVQSILQNQIEQFGNHVFKEGSVVIPGQLNYNNQLFCVKIENQYLGVPVQYYLNELVGKRIKGNDTKLRAKIIHTLDENELGNKYITLFISYLNSGINGESVFSNGEVLTLEENLSVGNVLIQAGEGFANAISFSSTAVGSGVILSSGVYFIRGNFVNVSDQVLILDPYENTPTCKVGFDVIESIVTADEDPSLYDNAQGFSNYAAPGADRLKIEAVLSQKPIDSDNNENYINLLEIRGGILIYTKNRPDYNLLQDELARRTSDESGDYYVMPFSVIARESLNDNLGNNGIFKEGQLTYNNNTPKESLGVYKISPGKAYVKGYEVEVISPMFLDFPKPRETKTLTNQSINYATGSTYKLNRVYGAPELSIEDPFIVSLRDSRKGVSESSPSGKEIGLARVYDFALESGSYDTTSPQLNEWNISLFDIQTYVEITLNEPITISTPIRVRGKSSGASAFLRYNTTNSGIITAYDVKGVFSSGEQLEFNGTDNISRIAKGIFSYSNKDIKSISNIGGSSVDFNADVKQDKRSLVGFASVTNGISGISTIVIGDDNNFNFTVDAKIGNLVSYTKPSETLPTYSVIQQISNKSIIVGPSTSVSGICNGDLSTTDINVNNLTILNSVLNLSVDNTLYTPFPRSYISSVDLTDSNITIRKEFSVDITSNQTNQINAGLNETFLSFDEERYALIRSDGTYEELTSEKFQFVNGSTGLVIVGLGSNDTGARLISTLRKINIKSRTKNKNRINILTIDKSRIPSSGIGQTSVDDGLTYGNYPYGTRVQDEEICLLVPDATRFYGVVESLTTSDPILPSLIFSNLNGPNNKTTDLVVGEHFTGKSSGAVGIYVQRKNDLKIEFIYLNDKSFQEGERVEFEESGIIGVIQQFIVGDKNIFNNYTFEYGQKDTIYDYSRIVRKAGSPAPNRKIKIIFESASCASSDSGDITVANSYNQFDYCYIPSLNSQIRATDILDIRPKVSDYTVSPGSSRSPFEFLGRTFSVSNGSAKNILASDESILFGYSFYLPRIDSIYLTKNGVFQLNRGEPAEFPIEPRVLNDALEIATVSLPPYLCDVNSASITLPKHRRYQMKDIGRLDDRLTSLEKVTALSLLEANTENLLIKDANGLDRFKSGFVVDNFSTSSIQNKSTIYKNSVDIKNQELRPSPYTTAIDLQLGSKSVMGIGMTANPSADPKYVTDIVGNNTKRTGQIITLDYSHTIHVNQSFSTRVENVTPFLVTKYNGSIELFPSSDVWVDQVKLGTKTLEVDTYSSTRNQLIASGWDPQTGYSPMVWGAWETTWTGSSTKTSSTTTPGTYGQSRPYMPAPLMSLKAGNNEFISNSNLSWYINSTLGGMLSSMGSYSPGSTTTTTDVTRTGVQNRTGSNLKLEEQTTNVSLGDSIVSTSTVSYMRSRNIEFKGNRFKPYTQLYAYFDGEDVNSFIIPKLIEISMISGTFAVGEKVVSINQASQNLTPRDTNTSISFRVATSNHKSGPYNAPTSTYGINPYNSESNSIVPSTYSSTSELLNVDTFSLAEQAQGEYFGYLVPGQVLLGLTSGAQARVNKIRLFTDNIGGIIGSFFIPVPSVPTNPTFETGTKTFKLTSSPINSQINSNNTTSAEQNYYALGILNSVRETVISTRSPIIKNGESITETKNISDTSTSVSTTQSNPKINTSPFGKFGYCYWDPLAQSFFVSEEGGIFATKIDLYFQTKDTELPVTVQLRPMVNGVPTTEVYPFSEVTISPDQINISDDASLATTIEFPSPVYLQGKREHALVILSESNEYNVWISRLGEIDITSLSKEESQQIVVTQQTLLGSLFKSQNGSTWDASQYEDLKFTLYKAKFSTKLGDVNFYNPELNYGNGQVANLVNNPLEFNSRRIRVGLSNTITDSNFTVGNLITQSTSNASGTCVGFAGSATGDLTIINSGIGYKDGTYTDVPLINITGSGSNATANLIISSGSIVALGATVFDGGFGYQVGDVFTVKNSDLDAASSGRNIRLSLANIVGNNQIIIDKVQGEYLTGVGNSISYYNGTSNIQLSGVYPQYVNVDSNQSDGLHIKVNHKNHGMYSNLNVVSISNAKSDIKPARLSENYSNGTLTSIVINSDLSGDLDPYLTFENVAVSSSNPGYILIGNEIISYESISTNLNIATLSGITRGIDQTKSFSYSLGEYVYKYELNGVSLRRINKVHYLIDSNIIRSVDLDYYHLKIDMSSGTKGSVIVNGPNGLVDRSEGITNPKLYIKESKLSGGQNILATQNIQYDIVKPILQNMNLTNTSMTAKLRTVSGLSVDGNESAFQDLGYQSISMNNNTYFNSPRIVASKVNETQNTSTLPGGKSLTLNIQMNTSDENISPVVDIDRVGMIFVSNRINNPVGIQTNVLGTDPYAFNDKVSTLNSDPSAFVYATNTISLEVPASSIKLIVAAYVNTYSDLRAFYSIMKSQNENPIYYPFPGYNNIYSAGQPINLEDSNGTEDYFIKKTDAVGFLSDELIFRDYEFTIDNLPDFRYFSIKLIGTSTNEAYPPRIKDLRALALG